VFLDVLYGYDKETPTMAAPKCETISAAELTGAAGAYQ
jgi:hypothetical protein